MLDVKLKIKPGHTSERSWMEDSPLKSLYWNVTYACNFHCSICFTDAGERHPDELTTDEAKDLIRHAYKAGVRDIIISGGEPFMRQDMVEILAYMAELGISARIASNGSLLTDELLDRLRHETLAKSFQISLDTLDPDLFSEIHRVPPTALQSSLDALKRIRQHGFHTTVSVRLSPHTLLGIPQLLDRAFAEGWATVTVHCPLHTRRIEGAFPQDADVLSFLSPVFDRFLALPERWLIETYIPWAEYHPLLTRLKKDIRIVHRGCRAGRDRLTINPSGWVSPCVCMDVPAAHIGNIRRDRLTDVFSTAPICEMMRHPQEHRFCVDCPHVGRCGGGCRAAAFAITGQIDGQDESCIFWRRKKSQKANEHGRS